MGVIQIEDTINNNYFASINVEKKEGCNQDTEV